MRILHFCMLAPFTEGYSYQDNLLTEYQHKHGHDVRIVTTTKTRGENGKFIYTDPCQKTTDNGVELVRVSVKSKLRNAFGIYSGMLRQMIDYRPDLIFIHGLCTFIPKDAVKYKKKYHNNVHIVADNHQDEWNTDLSDGKTRFITKVLTNEWKRWIKCVDKIYGTTSWRVRFARECYQIPDSKLDILVLGVDADRLPDQAETRKSYRSKYHIHEDDFLFITGGKLNKNKHIIESINAFAQIDHPHTKFLVFGSLDDAIKEEFLQLCNSDSRIIYVGFIPSQEVMNYYAAADFGVFPNSHSVLWEEAIGCGLPCLFHRYEEKDHTEVCDNCVCIENADTETIRSVMEKVLTDREYYTQMQKNAHKAAEAFSYHMIAEKSVECCSNR